MALSAERMSAALGDTAQIVAEQLRLQRARIDADIADQDKLQQEQARAIAARSTALQAQLVELDGQLALQQQQARNASCTRRRKLPV